MRTTLPSPLVTEIPSMENGGVSEDGLVITMNLRDDIVWSDGTPITCRDFVFTYEMIMDPGQHGVLPVSRTTIWPASRRPTSAPWS